MSKFEGRGLLAAAASADGSQLTCRISMARSSPDSCSCALAVTELWCLCCGSWQKRWAYASRLSSSVLAVDIAYMNWNGTQSLLALTLLTPAAVSSFLMPSTANVLELSGLPFGPVPFGQWNVAESPLSLTRPARSPGAPEPPPPCRPPCRRRRRRRRRLAFCFAWRRGWSAERRRALGRPSSWRACWGACHRRCRRRRRRRRRRRPRRRGACSA